ncbi:RNA polymerase sigma factor [Actibacterium sp. 188UL27-1]|uniref:RNA polymerase sigma factor n=1 Tax=Actibacterium sp. 188UL27-1 TaxID=2786961 RepID=UPI001959671C|nr:RNA polymerase sigma factor [Actibacterium sp. 188UL27-1]MBM7069282.1 RNA polymerase sigma factor [Actibacterium sp. 188UL27-1]
MVSTPERFKSDLISMLPRLRRFAMTLTRSAADADDLVQDACATALLKWSYYDPTQPLDRWVFRILRNQWISETRKRKVRVGQGQIPADESHELVAREDSDTTLMAQQVVAHVSTLPAELSEPLMLVCSEGYSYREVADLLEMPIGTVMSRIHRARKELSALLSPAEGATP